MTRELTVAQKEVIAASVTKRMDQWYGDVWHQGGSCLYVMHAGLVTLKQHGIECFPAAGTAGWEIQPDDGKMSHFTFAWNGKADGTEQMAQVPEGMRPLPEMHCWVWLPDTREVVDFSTGKLPNLAKQLGFEWKSTPPPPFTWARPESLFPRAIYLPNREATTLAVAKLFASRKGIR